MVQKGKENFHSGWIMTFPQQYPYDMAYLSNGSSSQIPGLPGRRNDSRTVLHSQSPRHRNAVNIGGHYGLFLNNRAA